MVRPLAWVMAQRTISSGDFKRSSTLALAIWSEVIFEQQSNEGTKRLRYFVSLLLIGLLLQKHPVAPVAEAFAGVAFLRKAREQGTQFVFNVLVLDHVFPDAVEPGAGGVATETDLVA